MQIAIRLQFYYYSAIIAIARLDLSVNSLRQNESGQSENKRTLMASARAIIELTKYIDTEAYTPIWVLGIMPLTALFILFDFVIHNPTHHETKNNLALLDVVTGYFSRLEYATEGSLPSSILAEFSHIARQFVNEIQSSKSHDMQVAGLSSGSNHQQIPTVDSSASSLLHPYNASDPSFIHDSLFYPDTGFDALDHGHGISPGFNIMDIFDFNSNWLTVPEPNPSMDLGGFPI
jgi:hypothetical protein